jgi:hypothetical protein
MSCANLTKEQLGQITLAVVQAMNHNNPNIEPKDIGPSTGFDKPIGDDGIARQRYRKPIVDLLNVHKCKLAAPPDDFGTCGKVEDMMQLVADKAIC